MTNFQPGYLLFVGVAVLMSLLFPVARHIREQNDRRQYYFLQGLTLVGAIVGAKLSVMFGDQRWPWTPVQDWSQVVSSGRSITGALLLGFLSAELAKPLIGYTLPPNDRFAALLPFSVAIGRIGCLTAGCCNGTACDGWWAMRGMDGLLRHPVPVYEMIFQILVGVSFVVMVKRGWLFGRLFSLYLMLYGAFRFVTEFVRDTPKFYGGWSGYQIIALVMMATGAAFFLKRTLAPPAGWAQWRAGGSRTSSDSQTLAGVTG